MFYRLLTLALIPYALWLIFFYRYHFLDGVNLLFHEAGHIVFGFLGETMHFLGGTLGQLFFPCACALSFVKRQQYLEAAVCGVWFGESLMYMAVYLGDARAQRLPLVGGHIHDWHWLLSKVGWLEQCTAIAGLVHFLASVVVIYSLTIALHLAFQKREEHVT